MEFLVFASVLALLLLLRSMQIVPQQHAWVVERMGSFKQVLEPGLHFVIPSIDRVAYKHSLKESAHAVTEEVLARDNKKAIISGTIYLRITDPKEASYNTANPIVAATQMAGRLIRDEFGILNFAQCSEERVQLSSNIVDSLNRAARNWGITCTRCEINRIETITETEPS